MKRKHAVTALAILALFAACSNPLARRIHPENNGENKEPPEPASPITIVINMTGNVDSDNVIASPESGLAGEEITLAWTVANTKDNNKLVFSSATNAAIASVDSAGTGESLYIINEEDAIDDVITINAAWTHTDNEIVIEPSPITIVISKTGNIDSDDVIASPEFGFAGDEITLAWTVADTKDNNRLVFSGTDAVIDSVNGAGTGESRYTINEEDAIDDVITINAAWTHTNKTPDTIAFADTHNVEKIYGDGLFAKAIANSGAGSGAISYSSSDPAVAAVDSVSGEVRILKAGTAVITATKEEDDEYAQTAAVYTLIVEKKTVTITGLSAESRVYDGTRAAAIAGSAVISGKVGADTVTTSAGTAAFEDKNAGTGKTVTFSGWSLTGADMGNYSLSAQPASVAANITQLQLTIAAPAVTTSREYNGATSAGVTPGALSNKVMGDTVDVSAVADFNSANVAEANQITVVYNISGADAANYIKPANYTIAGTITKAAGRTVSVPEAAKTQNSITVNAVSVTEPAYGQSAEYARSSAASPVPVSGWQDGLVFSGLSAGTYYIFARSKANANCNAGTAQVSAAITITSINPPSTGAVVSGIYRNMFKERGKGDAEITTKVNNAWNQLFNGTTDQKIYYEVAPDMAYILDVNNNDVRSEGMSYGMMMCVQMNDQTKFDRLWKWAKTYMYNPTKDGKNQRGYFAWQCSTSGSKMDAGAAPDGEEYFVTALLFASARWGNGSGIFDYRQQARQLLYDMLHRFPDGNTDGYEAKAMFDQTYKMPVFSPFSSAASFTDPSYHLPAFYEVWAAELENDYDDGLTSGVWSSLAELRADIDFYKQAASVSRSFFQSATNPTTGLGPDYANFNGTPKSEGTHEYFEYDAWRIAMNIAMDYAWWAKDEWQKIFADKIQAFFFSKGISAYGDRWTLDGLTQRGADHSSGLVACNAAASLAATNANAWQFIDQFWNTSLDTGRYRYYNDCLYMLALLHLSGNFKAYLSNPLSASISPAAAVFDKKAGTPTNADIPVTITFNGNTFVSVKNGAAVLASGADYYLSGNTVTLKKEYMAAQAVGTTTLTLVFSAGKNKNIAITIKDTSVPLLKYDSANWPAANAIYVTNTGQLNVTVSGGVLNLVKTSGYSTPKFVLPFNVVTGNLSNYSDIKVRIKVSSGDGGTKNVKAWVGSGYSTELGSKQATLTAGGAYQDVLVPITHASANTYTGEINIAFAIDNTNPVNYEIMSIELVPRP